MSALTSLALTDVRCFQGTQRAKLPRITVLVGENSAGKTSFLGCVRALAHLSGLHDLNDDNHFDAPPFTMGSFDSIARFGAMRFSLEATLSGHCYDRIRVVYDEGPTGQPREQELELRLAEDRGHGACFNIARSALPGNDDREMWKVAGPDFEFEFEQSSVSYRQFSTWLSRSMRRGNLPYDGDSTLWRKRTGNLSREADKTFPRFVHFFRESGRFPNDTQTPLLAVNDPVGWTREREYPSNPFGAIDETVLEEVQELGGKLGLFDDLQVRRGKAGCYEVRVDVSDRSCNLVDVGFGVQAALPLLLAIAKAPEGATLLLQQPEAHLHPQVQANLASVLAARKNRLLIETHSDHLPDWFRIAVMSEQVDPQDLGILYFHRSQDRASTQLYDIDFDELGNMGDTPPHFRRFFVEEAERLLGFRK